jgi:hypothetical protein
LYFLSIDARFRGVEMDPFVRILTKHIDEEMFDRIKVKSCIGKAAESIAAGFSIDIGRVVMEVNKEIARS